MLIPATSEMSSRIILQKEEYKNHYPLYHRGQQQIPRMCVYRKYARARIELQVSLSQTTFKKKKRILQGLKRKSLCERDN